MKKGKIVQVMGPVLDIRFRDGELPALLNAVELENNGKKLIVEVAQHIGDNVVRCIAMAATDGLVRGTDAVDTGEPIKVPVGDECLGRVRRARHWAVLFDAAWPVSGAYFRAR